MRRCISATLLALISSLIPCLGFSWGEGRNFIDDVEIYSIYVDSNYIFCGTNTAWGANQYGMFILDRKTGQWQNYSQANCRITNDIMAIVKVDSFTDVLAGIGTLRFKMPSMDYVFVDTNIGHRNLRFFHDSLVVGGRTYITAGDSVVIKEDDQTSVVHVFTRLRGPYGSGSIVTDCFLYDSLVILTTATRVYEHNILAASGFLVLSPQDLTVKPWSDIELSDKPLALLCVEQDEKELWIGTNRGVYCIKKNTGEKTHYNVTKGIVVADTLRVYCDLLTENSPNYYEYYIGDSVVLLGEKEFSMQIALPETYSGYLSKDYVKEELDDPTRGRVVRIKDPPELKDKGYLITIKASQSGDSENITEFYTDNIPTREFVFSSKSDNWYFITLPNTGWVPMKDLVFYMEEVPD